MNKELFLQHIQDLIRMIEPLSTNLERREYFSGALHAFYIIEDNIKSGLFDDKIADKITILL